VIVSCAGRIDLDPQIGRFARRDLAKYDLRRRGAADISEAHEQNFHWKILRRPGAPRYFTL
jgi:hypothetical protein